MFLDRGHVRVPDKDCLFALQYEGYGLGDRDAVGIEQEYHVVLEVLALRESLVYVHDRELAGIGDGMHFAEVRVAELVEQRAVLLALLRMRLRCACENFGEVLVDELHLGARPCVGAGVHNLVADGAWVLQVLPQALAAVRFHLFEKYGEVQVRIDAFPAGAPLADSRKPLVQAQTFERGVEPEFLGEVSGCREQVLYNLFEFLEMREHRLELVPVRKQREQQVVMRVVLELLAEVVDKRNLLVQGNPVGFLVEPVLAEQVVAEDRRVLVGALVVLQLEERVDEVEQVRVGSDFLRVLEDLQQLLLGRAVAVGEPLEGRLEAIFEFVAEREDVLVDCVVRVDVRGLPVVADPAVAGFGERTDRILVGVPA